MYIVEVRFAGKEELDDDFEIFSLLLDCWRTNGQILGREFPIAFIDGVYRTFLMIPEQDALDHNHNSYYVSWSFERLKNAGLDAPSVHILSEDAESSGSCSCSSQTSLILYTTLVTLESCLRCGDCFNPVPLYKIPQCCFVSHSELHDKIMSWQSDYQACDTLQMNCSTGERFGLREMGQLDSSLSKRGRELCSVISQALNTPTYYYLHRYRGKSDKQERARLCPSCGGEWLLEEKLHDKFDFKCDNCKLLSNVAFS